MSQEFDSARAPGGGIVTSVEPLADEAGADMLRKGGNAADAAVATAFAQGVVDPIYCGIAGGFHGLFHDAGAGVTRVVSAGGRAPRNSRPDQWRLTGQWGAIWSVEGNHNRYGYQASMVPGFVRGAWEAFSRFGSGNVSWQEIIEPSIRLARDGFEVYPYLYRLWMPRTERMLNFLESGDGPEVLGQTEECRRIYLKDGDQVYEIGDVLVQEDYARTLERVAEEGPDDFYEGFTGRTIAEDFARNGGFMTADDLREYRADILEPIVGTYHDLEVVTEPVPSVGPVTMEILNIVEGWDLPSLGWNTAPYLDRLARAMHVAFRDRLTVLGDPDFVDVPMQRLLSKEYAAEVRGAIERGEDLGQSAPRATATTGTTHVSVMDRAGNAAAITHSLGLSSGVVTPGLGFQHNCHMVMFDPTPGHRNSIAPWKRPITGGGPVLFKRDAQPWLLIGSPAGARKVTALVQAMASVYHFGKTIQEAVAAERIHVEDQPRTVIVEPHFTPETLMELARLGQDVRFELYTARLGAVLRHPSGQLEGGTDPRGGRGLAVV